MAKTYAYVRVSTDKQTNENQRFIINQFCKHEKITIDKWIEETISGTVEYNKRKLGKAIKRMQAGDTIIAIELSRLGRTLFMIMDILNVAMKKDIKIWTIRDNYRLGDDISSKVLAFAFGLSAEIERNLISQRTKEGLARRVAEGVVLGRPMGAYSSVTVLSGKEYKLKKLLLTGLSQNKAAKKIKVSRTTVNKFVKQNRQWIYDDVGDFTHNYNKCPEGCKRYHRLKKQREMEQKNDKIYS